MSLIFAAKREHLRVLQETRYRFNSYSSPGHTTIARVVHGASMRFPGQGRPGTEAEDYRSAVTLRVILLAFVISVGVVIADPVFAAVPVANFTADPLTGYAPLAVQFTDHSTGGTPSGYSWYFGDEQFAGPWELVTGSAEWGARYGHTTAVLPDATIVLMGGAYDVQKNDVWTS